MFWEPFKVFIYLLIFHLKGRDRVLHSLVHSPNEPQQLGLGQAEAMSWDPIQISPEAGGDTGYHWLSMSVRLARSSDMDPGTTIDTSKHLDQFTIPQNIQIHASEGL